jgi:4-carboxymuconolactone decarboxylase
MVESSRMAKGLEIFKELYGDQVTIPPGAEAQPFTRLMLENLFAEVWSRDGMPIRDRRLILIGAIAASADVSLAEIQMRAAVEKGELKREQLREIPVLLTQYIGYPRTVPLMYAVERILADA